MATRRLSSERRHGLSTVVSELFRYRTLIGTLVTREMKARYRGSALGFVWTILNPLILMAVYSLVFRYYMRFDVDDYAAFLLCGILPWTYFSSALTTGANSILSGGSLITKSLFPPHVLPTVTVLAQLVHYVLALPVLLAFLIWSGIPFHATLMLLPLVLLLQTLLTWGLVLALSALNVHFRDTQHVLGNFLFLWFFLCPVLYPVAQIPEAMRPLQYVNPIGLLIEAYHGILLYGEAPKLLVTLDLIFFTLAAVFVGHRVFEHYRETFPELV